LFTSDTLQLSQADLYVVTVPTPIDNAKRPDLTPLSRACTTVGQALRARADSGRQTMPLIIFESTVYPGATEDVCVPILETESGLSFNKDFVCGYSPERINPGDTEHKLTTIIKVTSGSTAESSAWITSFYASIVTAGTYQAPSIKVAEAAKVIENTQRDLNIALINELSIIFRTLQIDTLDVLDAAGTKWNFLPFRPGLVGGHCIGVDPYYLTHKAEQTGYHPQVVLAGRRINDGMALWLVEQLVHGLADRRKPIVGSRVLVLGLSFKENCPDLRNTKIFDFIVGLRRYGAIVEVADPFVDSAEAIRSYGLTVLPDLTSLSDYCAIAVMVAHNQYVKLTVDEWRRMLSPDGIILDLKGIVPRQLNPIRP